MKFLYKFLLLSVIATAVSFGAKADITVTLKVDDATRLTGYIQYTDANYNNQQTDLDLSQYTGEGNTFVIPASCAYVYINATDGNCIVSATNETTGQNANLNGNTGAYFYLYEDATLSVTSADLESTRTATCTVKVDDASKVNLTYNTGSKIDLQNGDNTVKFNPNNETPFWISHVNYGETLYSVKLNETEQSDSYGRYYVSVADGDILDITANFPSLPATITFSYGENEAEVIGCISVQVNGENVTDFDNKNLSVMMGDKVNIIGNTDLYNFNHLITVNGSSHYFSSSYKFTVTSESNTVEINATKYTTHTAYLTVDAPENIEAYAGNSNTPLELTASTATAVQLTSNANYINVRPATDCNIVSIQVNGTEYGTVNGYGTSSTTIRNINENDQIVITTKIIARDKTATIWVDDINAAKYGYMCSRYSDRANVTLISNEAVTINFDDADNPYYMSFYEPACCLIFINGVYQTPQYEGSTSYYVTFANNDAAKVYLASEPEKYAVTFTQSVENAVTEVTTDNQPYANWATGFTALTGTQVALTLAETDKTITVSADGVNLTANENGQYVVEISKDTNIEIKDETSAITEIETVTSLRNDVYNMQGILLIKNATAEQLNSLPSGLYIINGKKVIR